MQLLQLHARCRPTPTSGSPGRSTRSTACATRRSSTTDDADALEAAYRFCERARNALYLQTAHGRRIASRRPVDAAKLALLARLPGEPATALRDDYRRVTRRARRVVERVFYGLEPT